MKKSAEQQLCDELDRLSDGSFHAALMAAVANVEIVPEGTTVRSYLQEFIANYLSLVNEEADTFAIITFLRARVMECYVNGYRSGFMHAAHEKLAAPCDITPK